MEGSAEQAEQYNWRATATVVRPYRGTSLECRKVKAEDKAKARMRIRVTAAKPRLGTSWS